MAKFISIVMENNKTSGNTQTGERREHISMKYVDHICANDLVQGRFAI